MNYLFFISALICTLLCIFTTASSIELIGTANYSSSITRRSTGFSCVTYNEFIFNNFDIDSVATNETGESIIVNPKVWVINESLLVWISIQTNSTYYYVNIRINDTSGVFVDIPIYRPCQGIPLTSKRDPITFSPINKKSVQNFLVGAMSFNFNHKLKSYGSFNSNFGSSLVVESINSEPFYFNGDTFLNLYLPIDNVDSNTNVWEWGVTSFAKNNFTFLQTFPSKPLGYSAQIVASQIYSNYIEVDIIQNGEGFVQAKSCADGLCFNSYKLNTVSGTPSFGKYIYVFEKFPQTISFLTTFSNQLYLISKNFTYTIDPLVKNYSSTPPLLFYSTEGVLFHLKVEKSQTVPSFYYKGLNSLPVINDPMERYPFGLYSGKMSSYTFIHTDNAPNTGAITSPLTLSLNGIDYLVPSISFIPDVVKPILKNITFTRITEMRVVVRASFSDDNSGLKAIFFDSILPNMTLRDLVEGNSNDGVLEKIISYSQVPNITRFIVSDYAGNEQAYFSNYFGFDDNVITFSNIEYFYFKYNNINLDHSGYGFNNTLYFKHSGARYTIPSFKLLHSFKVSQDLDSGLIDYDLMTYDTELGCFKLDFFIPPNLFTGNLEYSMYIGGYLHNPLTLQGIIGSNATLSVKSSNADEMPPIIISLDFFGGLSNLTILGNSGKTKVGWVMMIQETINGFKNGTIKVKSDLDYIGYTFIIDSCSSLNKDPLFGLYYLLFDIDNQYCQPQTYYIDQIDLCDNYDHCSSTKPSVYRNSITPYRDSQMSLKNITLNCPGATVDTRVPTIENHYITRISLDVTSYRENRTVGYNFTATDESGISDRHTPILYLSSMGQVLSFPFTTVDSGPTHRTYNVFAQVPYLFGYPNGIIGQLFGVTDNYLNFNSFSSFSIKTTADLKTPYIDGIKLANQKSGAFYVNELYGLNLLPSDLVVYHKGQNLTQVVGIVEQLSTMIIFQCPKQLLPGDSIFYFDHPEYNYTIPPTIQTSCPIRPIPPTYESSSSSQSLPSSSSSEENTIPCLGTPPCGGDLQGQCTPSGCKCIYPYIGVSCSSKTIVVDPVINSTSPSTAIDTKDQEQKASYSGLISIYSIREYNGDNQLVKEYPLSEWIYTNASSEGQLASNYTSSIKNTLDSSITNISTTIRYFIKEETISFAGQELQMYPSSIKYNVELSPYSFSSSLGYLQMVFGVSLNTSNTNEDVCSSKSNGQVFGADDYFQININSYGLYGRFIKRAVIDSRRVSITNIKMNTSQITQRNRFDSVDQFIGINIPFYRKSALIDPDFSLIVDTSAKDQQESVCNSKSSKLTTGQIAGIVVGSVAFVAIVFATIVYLVKNKRYKESSRKMKVRLENLNKV
ncbi:hypothetical protein CYY_001136 [Polysphondylium violaceum]|uniref:EGF-like domain-containing protein n=1 Tax=Polysphondylium violaceum TaxID=133409 RepID=A0A8J4V4R3_9MYCE|nr:hypothetical protein CYY_001136 [Polysphondylium violaceum]